MSLAEPLILENNPLTIYSSRAQSIFCVIVVKMNLYNREGLQSNAGIICDNHILNVGNALEAILEKPLVIQFPPELILFYLN